MVWCRMCENVYCKVCSAFVHNSCRLMRTHDPVHISLRPLLEDEDSQDEEEALLDGIEEGDEEEE
eukprot:CAMPEP_0198433872 /NCGR_PEP_ID=MMETSP1452-20131203/28896_1 /TAXON_ID=1181717 /ORGANISM="Synchroma pusillum, Strain CCMP3072" /LENGTH=64 /DNA_ID=CAMNT_0044154369 /DNA_START=33 /DNA_END=224 /DNA_ORIENTATION=+